MRSVLPWLVAALVIAADRITKMAIVSNLDPGAWREIMPGLALTHVHNRGIAFSLFSNSGNLTRVFLHLVIFTSVVIIAAMLVRHARHSRVAGLAFGLILGGAIGNLIDRVLYGWVIDFIHVWVRWGEKTMAWPDFNIADASISVGAVLLILNEFRGYRLDSKDAPDTD
jgi:signal peptidase II